MHVHICLFVRLLACLLACNKKKRDVHIKVDISVAEESKKIKPVGDKPTVLEIKPPFFCASTINSVT